MEDERLIGLPHLSEALTKWLDKTEQDAFRIAVYKRCDYEEMRTYLLNTIRTLAEVRKHAREELWQ